jgi:hypothetical protein
VRLIEPRVRLPLLRACKSPHQRDPLGVVAIDAAAPLVSLRRRFERALVYPHHPPQPLTVLPVGQKRAVAGRSEHVDTTVDADDMASRR